MATPPTNDPSAVHDSPPRTYNETMTEGLASLTDLMLSNSVALEEVKRLIYERYGKEDERRLACDEQRQDMRDTLNRLAGSISQRLRETELSRNRHETGK